eukprot:gb/GECG01010513.1/.p1 GENE.gb/GECG01010513.1/~~gb/GECG01010513.1/.p1  ORF type:complete len:144 (+),score=19.48 gb/GECG01010513.1/:1-432(+)
MLTANSVQSAQSLRVGKFQPGAKPCDESKVIATNVEVSMSPSNPGPGESYSLTVSYDLGDTVVDGGKAKYYATLGGFPVVNQSDDLCEDLKDGKTPCPLTGHVSSTTTDVVPDDLPHGNLHSTITYIDQSGNEVVCIEVDLKL